jgi:hypothetical protein
VLTGVPKVTRIVKPRIDAIKGIYLELGQAILNTLSPTVDDIRGAVALMKTAISKGDTRWTDKVPKYEAWLAKQGHAETVRAHGEDMFPPPGRPNHLSAIMPQRGMTRSGASPAGNPLDQFTEIFKTPANLTQDARTFALYGASPQGRNFGAYPLLR